MRILLVCTAHNSLSQRLQLLLAADHHVTVEYALSADIVVEAARLARPHLVICPFLTTLVPREVYTRYMTLIVHPGPPGDAGPSALDWLLMGDDGETNDASQLLARASGGGGLAGPGRSHWGVTVLQAIEEFDAGPVWAFEQFAVNIDEAGLTKSTLYRGAVTRAAMAACLAAIGRISAAAAASVAAAKEPGTATPSATMAPWDLIGPHLQANPEFSLLSVTSLRPFAGGRTQRRPLLKAAQRDFDPRRHGSVEISRRIRAADSQPGCLSSLFGPGLYLYGGAIEEGPQVAPLAGRPTEPGTVIAVRDEAVCIGTRDGRGVWITHLRRVKRKTDMMLWVKVPAANLLAEMGLLGGRCSLLPALPASFAPAPYSTFQEIRIEYETLEQGRRRVAYVTSDCYNGAMSTSQCGRLVAALSSVLAAADTDPAPLAAVVMLGGPAYFSNGIHLNVIEAASDPGFESWANINAINDVAQLLLSDFPARGVVTVAAVRGNAAAGGVALAAACDVVFAGEDVVLNPAYRGLGLHGSEYHTVSYPGRCGADGARRLIRAMTPLSAHEAHRLGLVDAVLPGHGAGLDTAVREHVHGLLHPASTSAIGQWKRNPGVDVSLAGLSRARMTELAEMSKDFWSARSMRYHSRRRDFVRKVRPARTPLRFALHRRGRGGGVDEEETDEFDRVDLYEDAIVNRVRDEAIAVTAAAAAATATADRRKVSDMPAGPAALAIPTHLEPVYSCYYS